MSVLLHTPGRPTVHVCRDLAASAGPLIAAAIEERIRLTGRCRLGLSGGSTPAPVFDWLREHLPPRCYGQLLVTWVDERHLPVAEPVDDWRSFHADSNLRLACERWLGQVPLDPSRVLPLSLGTQLEAEVVRFGRAFLTRFDGALDVAVLGAGPDGHVASIFPDHPSLEVDDVCFAVHDSPKPPRERISLALPVLQRSAQTFVLARGAGKAAMLARAYAGDDTLPLTRVRPDGGLHWLLDTAAAADILSRLQTEAP